MNLKSVIVAMSIAVTPAYCSDAKAWGNVGIPDPVTWAIHAGLGFGVAWYLDTRTKVDPSTGVGAATAIGVLKEVSDVNFSVPDALAWGVGAAFYHYQKNMITCPEIKSELYRDDWYIVRKEKKLEDCK